MVTTASIMTRVNAHTAANVTITVNEAIIAFNNRFAEQRASTGTNRREGKAVSRSTKTPNGLGFSGYYFELTTAIAYKCALELTLAEESTLIETVSDDLILEARRHALGFLLADQKSIDDKQGGMSISGGAEREATRLMRSLLRRIGNICMRECTRRNIQPVAKA